MLVLSENIFVLFFKPEINGNKKKKNAYHQRKVAIDFSSKGSIHGRCQVISHGVEQISGDSTNHPRRDGGGSLYLVIITILSLV